MPDEPQRREECVEFLCREHKKSPLCSNDKRYETTFKDFARLCIENVERKLADFRALYMASCSRGDNHVDNFRARIMYIENYSMQTFKQKMTDMLESERKENLCQLANSLPAGIHRHALRACHIDLVNNLDLCGTTLLDELVACHLLEESDACSIAAAAERGERARTEAFLRRIQVMLCRDNFINAFLPILSNYSPEVESKLESFIQDIPYLTDSQKCNICQVKAFVQPGLLADVMYTSGVIDTNLHQDLREQNMSNQEKWEKLSTYDGRDIVEALRLRCESVYREFDLANVQSFECCCQRAVTKPVTKSTNGTVEAAVSDVANMEDLESFLDTADGDTSEDMMSLSSNSVDDVDDFTPMTEQEILEAREQHEFTYIVTDVCETEGFRRLHRGGTVSSRFAWSRSLEDTRQRKSAFGTTIKNFLNRQLYSFRHLPPWRKPQPQSHKGYFYDFDAFIMFAEGDRTFVMEDVRRELEDKHGMKLCVFHRDFTRNKTVAENILISLERSRKVVAVLSQAFFDSLWCKYGYDMAAVEGSTRNNSMCIAVLCVDIDLVPRNMACHLADSTCLDYATTGGDCTFWQDLVGAIRDY